MDLDEGDRYVYQPLGPGRQIRILLLQPAPAFETPATRSTIRCSLEEADLDDQPQYTALSYSWATEDGDDSKSQCIKVDGKPFAITRNLHDALLRFRAELDTVPLRLWVDAVCINQVSETEKSQQVGMMAQIFGSASKVIAWLGESGDERGDATAHATLKCLIADRQAFLLLDDARDASDFSWFAEMNFALHHRWARGLIWSGTYGRRTILKHVCYRISHMRCPVCIDAHTGDHELLPRLGWATLLRAITSKSLASHTSEHPLFERRWFNRRWVMQEINIPSEENVCFRWGSNAMSKTNFRMASRRCADVRLALPLPRNANIRNSALHSLQRVGATDIIRIDLVASRLSDDNVGSCIIDLVIAAGTTACADPHDLIYSMLSMASANHDFEADYTLSAAEVFKRFARLLIKEGRLGTLLVNCSGVCQCKEPNLDLPSWVPDLRSEPISRLMRHMRREGDPEALWHPVTPEDGVLSITLYRIGTLGETMHIKGIGKSTTVFAPSGKHLGQVSILQRDCSQEPEVNDVVCTIDNPAVDRWGYCCILRPLDGNNHQERMRIVGKFWLEYDHRKGDKRKEVLTPEMDLARFQEVLTSEMHPVRLHIV